MADRVTSHRSGAGNGASERPALRGRALSLSVLTAVALALSSCGVGGALAVSGGGGGGGSGSRPPRPTSTVVLDGPDAVGTEERPAGNLVRFTYRLENVRAPSVDVFPEFRLPQDSQWRPMTLVGDRASDRTRGLRVTNGRGEFSVLWNTLVDLPRPSSLNPTTRFILSVRVRFEYVDQPTPALVKVETPFYRVDHHLAATVASDETERLPVGRAVPSGVHFVSDGVLVANAKSDTVDHLSTTGVVSRRIGRGVFLPADGFTEPGVDVTNLNPLIAASELAKVIAGSSGDPAAVQPRALLGLTADAAGNIYTANHYFLTITNFGDAPRSRVADCTTFVPGNGFIFEPGLGPAACRRPALHPAGVLLYSDTTYLGPTGRSPMRNRILALNPQDASLPGSAAVQFAGRTIAPGECVPIYDTSLDPTAHAQAARIHNLVVGPSGEIYFDQRDPGNLDRVLAFNPGEAPVFAGGTTIPPGRAVAVTSKFRIVDPGTSPDTRGVDAWDDVQDGGHAGFEFLALAVAAEAQLLFVGVPRSGDQGVFVLDLAPQRSDPPTFAGAPVPRAADTVTGVRIVCDATSSRDAACRIAFGPGPINGIEVDPTGTQLFLAQANSVFLVNGGSTALDAFGVSEPIAVGDVAPVYDATVQSGIPIISPSALASRGDDLVLFADDRTIRALNLSSFPIAVGRTTVAAGTLELVGGATLPGFSGDGGPVELARFAAPAAMSASLQNALFVADTGNDRVRLVHIGDPAAADPLNVFGRTVLPGNVDTVAGDGGPGDSDDIGDGGPPGAATLLAPQGLALRPRDGVLFVADTGHHRIRAMNPTPTAMTIAGQVVPGNSIATIVGDGTDGGAAGGGSAGGDGAAPGTAASPTALAVFGDLLFFAETGFPRIRVLNLSPDRAATLGGDLVVEPGMIRTVCGTGLRGDSGDGGPAAAATIDRPLGLAVSGDDAGRPVALYFTDGARNVMRVVNLSAGPLALGTDASGRPDFSTPVLPGHVALVSARPAAEPAGECGTATLLGTGSRPPAEIELRMPRGVVVVRKRDADPGSPTLDAASVLAADCGNNRVVRFPAPNRPR